MKNWEKYTDYLETGDFHVHTNYTENSHTINEMCEQAILNGLKLICFAEHVRRTISYDYDELLKDIERARVIYPKLKILAGCEAKVLDTSGSLDVSKEILSKAEILVASFHSFHYGRKEEFMNALFGMLRNPRVDLWGHPATFLRNVDLQTPDLEKIINECKKRKVLIEDSLALPYQTHTHFTDLARKLGATVIKNSDAHSRDDLKKVEK
ncbi:MAG: PHP domain-containing protein [Gammaproteobacteria bacterium]|nr:PHP domain-containing protein [Gammaproteobacteria bacterium]